MAERPNASALKAEGCKSPVGSNPTLSADENEDIMTKPWHDERYSGDAPIHYDNNEAAAWASGYNTAIENAAKDLDQALAKELGNGTQSS